MAITVTEQLLRKIIQEELVNYQHKCVLNLNGKDASQLTQHLGGIKALGNGSISSGFNVMQENHRYWYEQRMFNKSVGNTFKKAVIGIVTGGLLLALVMGIKQYFMEAP